MRDLSCSSVHVRGGGVFIFSKETMDVICERIERAKDYTVDAEKELILAAAAQRKARQVQ